MKFLPTGIYPLDDTYLAGGVRIGSLTELVGPPGSAKTQLAIQIAVGAAAFRQGTIYIDSEQKMSLPRLRQIAEQRRIVNHSIENDPTFNPPEGRTNSRWRNMQFAPSNDVLQNLTVHSPSNMNDLQETLLSLEHEIFERNHKAEEANSDSSAHFPVRLIVVDSIAAPAKRSFDSSTRLEQATALMGCAQLLKRLAFEHHLAVVVVNQVVGSAVESETPGAALGMAWHHCVTTRLELNWREVDGTETERQRTVSVTKSNVVPESPLIHFQVSNVGLS